MPSHCHRNIDALSLNRFDLNRLEVPIGIWPQQQLVTNMHDPCKLPCVNLGSLNSFSVEELTASDCTADYSSNTGHAESIRYLVFYWQIRIVFANTIIAHDIQEKLEQIQAFTGNIRNLENGTYSVGGTAK